MDPLRVEASRNDTVESVHLVHAVVVREDRVVASRGDASLVTFLRSSAKPLQALSLARARNDLDDRDLAIASASHLCRPEHLDAVRTLLAKAPASEEDLECGPEGDPPRRICHNCSGKHAGMLALCRARGWPTEGYRLAGHPVQEEARRAVAAAAGVAPGSMPSAIDGCGVVTWALPLERMAHAFSRLEEDEAGARVAAAMRAHPELVRGEGALDTRVMQRHRGWTVKGGAEGLFCGRSPEGIGIALKVADGAGRALAPAFGAFLRELGEPAEELEIMPLANSRGEPVGELRAAVTDS